MLYSAEKHTFEPGCLGSALALLLGSCVTWAGPGREEDAGSNHSSLAMSLALPRGPTPTIKGPSSTLPLDATVSSSAK